MEMGCVQLNTSYQLLVYPTPRTGTLISTSTNLSPNIRGISDQDVTLWTLLQYKNDNQCAEVSFDKSSQPSRPSANDRCTQGTGTNAFTEREKLWAFLSSSSYILNSIRQSSGQDEQRSVYCIIPQECSIQLSWPQTAWVSWQDIKEMNEQ
jgi:hypothetical protein